MQNNIYGIVYKTTHLDSGRIYVGQTTRPGNTSYLGTGLHITAAIQKYGKQAFQRETLCVCYSFEELNDRERYWITQLDTVYPKGFNISAGGQGCSTEDRFKGWTQEQREAYENRMRNQDTWKDLSPEERVKRITQQTQSWRKSVDMDSLVQSVREANKKRKAEQRYVHSTETIEKIKQAVNSPEVKERRIAKWKVWWNSMTEEERSEYLKKQSDAHLRSSHKKAKGKYRCSEEQKQQISKANKGRVQSPEERQRRSEALKAYHRAKRSESSGQGFRIRPGG